MGTRYEQKTINIEQKTSNLDNQNDRFIKTCLFTDLFFQFGDIYQS